MVLLNNIPIDMFHEQRSFLVLNFGLSFSHQEYMNNNNNILSDFTTVKELAQGFHLSEHTIFRLLKAGDLGHVKIGHYLYVSIDDVESLLLRNSRTGTNNSAKGYKDSDVCVGQNGDHL